MRPAARVMSLLAALIFAGAVGAAQLPKGIIELKGQPAPPLVLQDMDGVGFDLADAKGRWVFVHFWASWCGPCRREMPAIQRMAEQTRELPMEIVLVNTAEDEDTVFSFLGVVAPDLGSLMDRDGQTTEAWQPRGLPATYIVGPQGRLRYQTLGGLPWDEADYLTFLRRISR